MSALLTIVVFLLLMMLLVIAHELGHFLAARAARVAVDEFGVGLPPKAATLGRFFGTSWVLGWLPIGGYVRLRGELGTATTTGDLAAAPVHARVLILLGGVTFNLMLAVLLLTGAFTIGVQPLSIIQPGVLPAGSSLLPTREEAAARGLLANATLKVESVIPGSWAEQQGMLPGDVLLSINGKPLQLVPDIRANWLEKDALLVTWRNNYAREYLLPYPEAGLQLGVVLAPPQVGTVQLPVYQAFVAAVREVWAQAIGSFRLLGRALADAVQQTEVPEGLVGPVGIAAATGAFWEMGAGHLVVFAALLSIGLAVMNILPLPILDGGRIIITLIEAVRGRALPVYAVAISLQASMALLLVLFVLITARDITGLFS